MAFARRAAALTCYEVRRRARRRCTAARVGVGPRARPGRALQRRARKTHRHRQGNRLRRRRRLLRGLRGVKVLQPKGPPLLRLRRGVRKRHRLRLEGRAARHLRHVPRRRMFVHGDAGQPVQQTHHVLPRRCRKVDALGRGARGGPRGRRDQPVKSSKEAIPSERGRSPRGHRRCLTRTSVADHRARIKPS
ncbi:hypothetical protein M885DRAFT_610862, partial [Pelagophyceae sp. CCMP2097]